MIACREDDNLSARPKSAQKVFPPGEAEFEDDADKSPKMPTKRCPKLPWKV